MDDKAHIEITKKAIKLSKVNLNENEVLTLTKYCIKPDYDERDYAYAYHFYNPTRKYKENEITALSKCLSHYEKAAAERDLEELGRAIHFLEDLCTPVHCGYEDKIDYVYRLHQHMEFEKMCDKLVDEINISDIDDTPVLIGSLKDLCRNCAAQSYVYFKELDKKSTDQKMIGERAILRAIQAVVGIINHYYAKQV